MARRSFTAVGAVLFAFAALTLLSTAPAAQARSCANSLPAKVSSPTNEVDEFERRAYVNVKPQNGAKLRAVKVKVKLGGTMVAFGVADGKITEKRTIALEFVSPLEAETNYEIVASGTSRGCSKRKAATEPVTFFDAGGGGGGGGTGGGPSGDPGIPGVPGANFQGLTVDWSGGNFEGNDSREFNVPGIGRGIVVCRPDTQWIRVIPDDPNRETAIVAFTYRRWDDAFEEGSVQEASTNAFGGTEFNLGFNKFGPTPEGRSTGALTGVISDRMPFGAVGGVGGPPTAVELSWQWDFTDGSKSRCHVDANFTTEAAGADPPLARSLVVNWRGENSSTGNSAWTAELPGLGSARVDCQPGVNGVRRFTLFPAAGVSSANFTAYEGSVPSTSEQTQGPYRYEMPNNGFVVADFGPSAGKLFLSSRWKSNDPDPSQNFCHLAGVLVSGR
ncbi:MAG: hypothetical protein ACR2OC_06445 [Solirubrobacterales bacterium]